MLGYVSVSKPTKPLSFGICSILVGFFISGAAMKYAKPALTPEQQADLILQRGLIADRDTLIQRLQSVSYYRLSAYWYPFRQAGSEQLSPGVTLDVVWDRYVFDRQLRLLVMDVIERVEIAIKTCLVIEHTLQHGPFGYLDRVNLPGMTIDQHRTFLEKIRNGAKNSREEFVLHFNAKYTSETDLPLWMAAEVMTFGGMLSLFRHADKAIKGKIAAMYGVSDDVLESWLLTLNVVRNMCAHHARLWNRGFAGKEFAVPRKHKHPAWHVPVAVPNDRMFGVLTLLRYLQGRVAPQSQWDERFRKLLTDHPAIPIHLMGFPADWMTCAIWKKQTT